MAELSELRKELDTIDEKMVTLLNRRAEIALQVREAKRKDRLQVYAPEREREILERVASRAGAFPVGQLQRIFTNILSATRSLVGDLRVSYLSPECSLTHAAALRQFGEHAEYVPAFTVDEVFGRVERGDASCGVVVARTSTEGFVAKSFDLLVSSNLRIIAEVEVLEHSALFSRTKVLAEISRVIGDARHLEQSSIWLQSYLPNAERVVVSDPVSVFSQSQSSSVAVVALEAFADRLGIAPIARGIAGDIGAEARCLVIGDLQPKQTGRDKTSIVCSVNDRPGALREMLEPFSKHGVTLLKIESRPVRERSSEFLFFVDVSGHIEDQGVADAIAELTPLCAFLKVLGSYPLVCHS